MKKLVITALIVVISHSVVAQSPVSSQYEGSFSQDVCQAMQRAADFLSRTAKRSQDGMGWSWKAQEGSVSANVTGLAALALLDAYRVSGDAKLLSLVRGVADGLLQSVASWSTENLPFKADIEFLARLGEMLGEEKYQKAARAAFAIVVQRSASGVEEVERIWQGRKNSAPRLLGFDVALGIRAAVAAGERRYAYQMADQVLSRSADWLPEGKPDRFGFVSIAAMTEALEVLDAPHYAKVIDRYRQMLVQTQQKNGSWVFNETQPSAYAALALASGTPEQREAWRKAIDWLKSTMLKAGSLATYNDYMPEPFVGEVISEVHAEALSALSRACGKR